MANGLKSAIHKVDHLFHHHHHNHQHHRKETKDKSTPNGSGGRSTPTATVDYASQRAARKKERALKKAERDRKRKDAGKVVESAKKERLEAFQRAYEEDPARRNFGYIPHDGRLRAEQIARQDISTVTQSSIGQVVSFRARIHTCRPMSSKLAFFVLRQHATTLQGVLRTSPPNPPSETHHVDVSELMVRFAERLPRETIVLVQGIAKKPVQDVKSADAHDVEILRFCVLLRGIWGYNVCARGARAAESGLVVLRYWVGRCPKLFVLAEVTESPPFHVEDAARPLKAAEEGKPTVNVQTKLANRAIDLRTPASQSIFRIQSAICKLVREYLDDKGFMEIHSAKLQGSATESGASVFKVDYFKRAAYLAQSPQTSKEIAIGADFERVYEIGPVFRAENSNTHRHMTEFTGIDLEMAIEHDYHEAMWIIDGLLKHVFKGLNEKYEDVIEKVKAQFPHETFVFPEKTIVLTFKEGVKLLREDGWGLTPDKEVDEYEDLSTRAEVRLGQLVKEKYGTDYYIIDKFPRSARPFYTMPDPDDPNFTNAFDIFCRGEEILSGGQRLHSAIAMDGSMRKNGIDPKDMQEYIDAYKWGMPPHAGGGIGLERLTMLFLGLGNIRAASMFPRDPRSFAGNPLVTDVGKGVIVSARMPVPTKGVPAFDEPDSLSKDPLFKPEEHPTLPDLISTYGDSTNTAWLDIMYEVWRYGPTGAAIGFVDSKGFAVTWGVPLCPKEDHAKVVAAYLTWLHEERHLKPVWLATDQRTEKFLADAHGWRVLSVISEQRVEMGGDLTVGDKNVQRKRAKAEKDGLKFIVIDDEITPELQGELEKAIRAWQTGRKGTQIHTTNVRPFADVKHRSYFIARDGNGTLAGLVVLAQLAPQNGYQIKWSLAFPDSPPGTSEFLNSHVMEEMRKTGVSRATFGVGAADKMEAVENLSGFRTKALAEAYSSIAKAFHLTNKSDYRRKFGAIDEALYVAYPKGGLGLKGIEAIINSVRDKPKKAEKKMRKEKLKGSDSAKSEKTNTDTSDTSVPSLNITGTGLSSSTPTPSAR
ncbi:uncharacterized protein EI90DRAFT_3285967 [Cantharellus anzutake]|uniref:uncharacterized protein n=1 Tax=Cantharellus anzutake TaxID=1750568 RepID=UPI0019085064|nr:uncharacterized protein EI90DRAFT_3285967 [Cantharellus anzutake]KAF8340653.1 hypothetical protein EI90DRAFT_3285967 [Cantharellus anzutake]